MLLNLHQGCVRLRTSGKNLGTKLFLDSQTCESQKIYGSYLQRVYNRWLKVKEITGNEMVETLFNRDICNILKY